MSALADQVGNHPVLLALLDRLEAQRQQLAAAEAAADQHGDHRVVPQRARRRRCGLIEEAAALLVREPVSVSRPMVRVQKSPM
jgi:hypothetical protein